jgi:hypothetical protein
MANIEHLVVMLICACTPVFPNAVQDAGPNDLHTVLGSNGLPVPGKDGAPHHRGRRGLRHQHHLLDPRAVSGWGTREPATP